jgi:hypothetical protein
MAVITNSTFDPLKVRCNVRLQQGVPIVDADWNELDDIRKYEMRAYLKWFVGDGIPYGSDAFRIDAIVLGVADDFIIRAGGSAAPAGTTNYDQALRFAGRAIVDGLDVLIPADVNYKAQPLFAAAGLGVPKIAPIPGAAGPVSIYLDVWERLVTSQEDPSLVLPGLGTESCARMQRYWCVRSRAGNSLPQPGDSDFIAGHSYYLLSILNRTLVSGNPAPIAPTDLKDQRHVKLALASVESRLANLERLLLIPQFAASPNQFNPKLGTPGTTINLFGSNLNLGQVSVQFGTSPNQVQAKLTGNQSPSQLNVVVPFMPAGTVQISITTSGGTTISTDQFTVLALVPVFNPSPNQFNPKVGAAGVTVNLFGSNFTLQGNATPSVKFGTTSATIVGSPTDTQINVTVPSMAAGATKISVTAGGNTVTSTDSFTVL